MLTSVVFFRETDRKMLNYSFGKPILFSFTVVSLNVRIYNIGMPTSHQVNVSFK